TRHVRVQAVFDNADGKLRPGRFVDTKFPPGKGSDVFRLPPSASGYARFGDPGLFVEEWKGPDARPFRAGGQQFVKLGGSRGDQVAVFTGIKPGEEVVTSGVFKLRPGAAVQVNNSVQPANSPAPKPEDS